MTEKRSIVRGVGALPARPHHDQRRDLARLVDTSDEWIVQRTGIRQRHIAAEGEVHLRPRRRSRAARRWRRAGVTIADIDLIIVATTTPDLTFPATAAVVQQKLGMHHGAAFDIQAVCSGFVYAVATADSFLKNRLATRALVIGAETASRILDWTDRTTCVLFGDGAGAAVVDLATDGDDPERGILATSLRSDGHFWDKLYTDGGPSSTALDRPHPHGGPRGLQARRRHDHRRRRQRLRATGYRRRRPRLVRAAPGQQAHHRRRRR